MGGWKTWTAVGIVALVVAGQTVGWISPEQAKLILEGAAGLGLLGLGHKVDKLRRGI